MTTQREDRLAALRAANQRKTQGATDRVLVAARALVEEGEKVNIHAVAARAEVARSFIYSHPDLLAAVRELGTSTPRLRTPSTLTRSTEESLRGRLADSLDRQRGLSTELDVVKAERETLLDEVRSLRAELRASRRQTSAPSRPPL